MKNYSVLITSCDSFEDAWVPFFKLYCQYWNDGQIQTYLITEKKKFLYPGVDIKCTQVNKESTQKFTWAESLLISLDQVSTEIVLLYMDDFFITQPVNITMIDEAANSLLNNKKLDAVYLSASGPLHCSRLSDNNLYCIVDQFSSYKVSMQACLWKKSVLKSLVKANENAWMFELFGTKRSHMRKLNFLRVKHAKDNPISYINTGITKGKWNKTVVPLFKQNGINLEFSERGFFEHTNKWMIKLTTLKTLIKSPASFIYHFAILPPLARIMLLASHKR